MSFPTLIGITGRSGVGKDTLAHYLHIIYGYHRYAFAQPIKDALNGVPSARLLGMRAR